MQCNYATLRNYDMKLQEIITRELEDKALCDTMKGTAYQQGGRAFNEKGDMHNPYQKGTSHHGDYEAGVLKALDNRMAYDESLSYFR